MNNAIYTKRKLIDIRVPVFEALSYEAKRRRTSLKRLVEDMLEEAAADIDRERAASSIASKGISSLIGSAKPLKGTLADIADDRLQYLLSK